MRQLNLLTLPTYAAHQLRQVIPPLAGANRPDILLFILYGPVLSLVNVDLITSIDLI
jgi:hypothetical protein